MINAGILARCESAAVYNTINHIHTHTQPFYGHLGFFPDYPGELTPGRYNQSRFTGASDREWQWHQQGHMQICTLTQTHNHAIIPPLIFIGRMPFLPSNSNQQRQSNEDNEALKVKMKQNYTTHSHNI